MKLRYTTPASRYGRRRGNDGRTARRSTARQSSRWPCTASSHAAAAAVKALRPDATVVYVMTDAASLPLALSDLVADLREAHLVDVTATAGHAFGGDIEAVNVALRLEPRSARSMLTHLVGMGLGSVGTGTELGFGGFEVGRDPGHHRAISAGSPSLRCACRTPMPASVHHGREPSQPIAPCDGRPPRLLRAGARRRRRRTADLGVGHRRGRWTCLTRSACSPRTASRRPRWGGVPMRIPRRSAMRPPQALMPRDASPGSVRADVRGPTVRPGNRAGRGGQGQEHAQADHRVGGRDRRGAPHRHDAARRRSCRRSASRRSRWSGRCSSATVCWSTS